MTVVGPGGAGKTRLALRYAERSASGPASRLGVAFADLSGARSRADLVAAVAAALRLPLTLGGATPVEQVARALASRGATLLLVDNFEHLTGHAAATIGAWLAAAQGARVLATSREALGLEGDSVVPVRPLTEGEARDFFLSRARTARPDFALGEDERGLLAEVTARLEGLPLAIELAAARVSVLTVRQLAERLSARWKLLAGGGPGAPERHRTLRATIDWSWDLLAPWEQAALAQAAVFRGGFDLDAFEHVVDLSAHGGAPWHVDVLQSLQSKSLVWAREGGAARDALRFGTYESIREYAAERLALEPGALELAHARHAAHYVALGDRLCRDAEGPEAAPARRRLMREKENVVAVAERGLLPGASPLDAELAAGAILSLAPLLAGRAPGELLEFTERLLGVALPPIARARALTLRATLRVLGGQHGAALPDLDESASLAAAHGARALVVKAGVARAAWWDAQGRFDDAARVAAAAVLAARDVGEDRLLAEALDQQSAVHNHRSQLGDACAASEESLALAERAGARDLVGIACGSLGKHAVHQRRLGDAVGYYTRALQIAREQGDRFAEARHSNNLAIIYHEERRHALAREHYERALRLMRELGRPAFSAIAMGNLGILEEEHDLGAARARFAEAQRILEEVSDPRLLGWCAGWLAAIDAELGDVDAARAGFARARALLEPLGERAIFGVVTVLEAHMDIARGEPDAAFARLEAAGGTSGGTALAEESEDVRFAMRSVERRLV